MGLVDKSRYKAKTNYAAAAAATGAEAPKAARPATPAAVEAVGMCAKNTWFLAVPIGSALIVLHHFFTRSDTKLGMRS